MLVLSCSQLVCSSMCVNNVLNIASSSNVCCFMLHGVVAVIVHGEAAVPGVVETIAQRLVRRWEHPREEKTPLPKDRLPILLCALGVGVCVCVCVRGACARRVREMCDR